MRLVVPMIVGAAILAGMAAALAQDAHGRLFPPENLGLLEGPDRDDWQQPERVMDALGIADGARVADIGAGGGWFTVRLARRVGPNGRVFAEDIQPQMLESIRRRVRREALTNVTTVLGTPVDPKLPGDLAAVLIVDVYPQMTDPVAVLGRIRQSLLPAGRLGIIDFKTDGAGGPGPPIENRLHPDVVIAAARRAGLHLQQQETFLRYQYLLVFGREPGER